MQIWAESGKSALPICNYSQILYQFLTFTQNLKRSLNYIMEHIINLKLDYGWKEIEFLNISLKNQKIKYNIKGQET